MADFVDRLWGARDDSVSGGLPGTSHHWEPLPGDEAAGTEPVWADDRLDRLADTRRSLHGLAELLLAGPQFARSHTIRLKATPGGFATIADPQIRVDGTDLLVGDGRYPLRGTYAHLAAAAGLTPTPLTDVYSGGSRALAHDRVDVDADAAHLIARAFAAGTTALREFAPKQAPVLWPEHFDVSVAVDEINYGVSSGDELIPTPYAYVGPFQPRTGEFWNQPFGAARVLAELPGGLVVAFFQEGRARAAADAPAG